MTKAIELVPSRFMRKSPNGDFLPALTILELFP